MSQRPRIEVRQSLRLKLTTGLQTAIEVLRMDGPALARHLEEQAAEVPGLVVKPPQPRDWLPRWTGVFEGEVETPAAAASMMAHVTAEIDRRIKGATPRRIALALAEALGPAGWLERPVAAIARDLGQPVAAVEAVLTQVQEMEPTGIFARDLADCLRLQAAEAGALDAVMALVLSRLDLLARADFAALAGLAEVEEVEILKRFRTIRTMTPKPGATFDDRAAPPLREPDLVLRGGVLEVSGSSLPGLALAEGAGRGAASALRGLERLVAARNATLLRVGHEVLTRQRAALEGAPLQPLTMAEVGRALGLAESTVSRVVAGTSVDTARGVWWLRSLFSRDMGGVSASALRDRVAALIAAETRPLSDQALAEMLAAEGAKIARRTVAKYREELGLPPASGRR
ncbi:RNA polymerase factor sigma-54 [Stagnihabitans tardus]|uniref:RNA polymerase sigma-54 factor n=1 Tax=Stagnihabitans tardus TaxID=2699202 RepID=A0AAE4YCH0_9RHOB|nr:RNA polymerase sigma-54 factor [Stagnihabitans tardus]NBZ89117.1 RNA polymerase sigma-54 factor [Stagnihabitans tardus]